MQKRLAFGLALVLVLVMGFQWVVVSFMIRHVTQEYMVSRLAHDAENLLANLDWSPDGIFSLNPARMDTIYTQPWSGHYYQIRSQAITLRSRSLWDADLTVPQGIFVQPLVETAPGPQSQTILKFTQSYYKKRKHITVTVAESMTTLNRGVFTLQMWYAGISSLAIVLLLILQRGLLRLALKPLDAASEEVRHLEDGTVGRVSTDAVPPEIVPFVTAINRLLAILADRLEKSRHAAGNMAHAIKTPLTVLLQLAESRELEGQPELRENISKQIQLIRALTGRELQKVRRAGADAPAMRVDIVRELLSLLDVMQRVHKARGLSFAIQMPKALSGMVDREDLLELCGNLLDNACKWAAGKVRLTVIYDAVFHMSVEDDGQGCAPEQYQQILQRGGRADATMHGYGIGMSVVKEIVDEYGGVLVLGSSEDLGGFCVQVTLPLKGLLCEQENHADFFKRVC